MRSCATVRQTHFHCIVGDTRELANVKYVITLDTDTQLPRDAARELVGAMAHPLNRAQYCEPVERVCEGYGILQPRVGACLPGASAVALRSRVWKRARNRPLYARCLRCVPGSVRRGFLHRQGDLRCGCVRARAPGAFPGQPHSEPRSGGELLRALGTAQRCAGVRGISGHVQRRREPPPSLDSRRLAIGPLAAALGSRRRGAAREPDQRAVPMETLRQSSPQPGARGADLVAAAELGVPAATRVLDPGRYRHYPDFRYSRRLAGPDAKAQGGAVETAPELGPDAVPPRMARRPLLRWRAFRTRRTSAWTPSCARCGGCWCRAAACWNGAPSARPAGTAYDSLAASWRTMWIGPVLALASLIYLTDVAAQRIPGGVAGLGAVGLLSEHRLVDQPARSAARGALDGRTKRLPAQARAQDLGLL